MHERHFDASCAYVSIPATQLGRADSIIFRLTPALWRHAWGEAFLMEPTPSDSHGHSMKSSRIEEIGLFQNRDLADAVVACIRDIDIAACVDGDAGWQPEHRVRARTV